jgi:hypothetical protein
MGLDVFFERRAIGMKLALLGSGVLTQGVISH